MMHLTHQYLSRRVLLILSIFVCTISVQIQATESNDAMNGLIQALEDAESRLTRYEDKKHIITLEQTSTDKDGNISKHQLKPVHYTNSSNKEDWQLIEHDESFSSLIEVANDLLLDGSTIDINKVILKSESDSAWVFNVPNNINVKAEDEEQIANQEMISIDSEIAKNLFTEVIVDKGSRQIKSLKIYAKDKFKPSMMVTIEKFELRLDYVEAWLGGPLIRQNFTRHIKGKYGWLIKLEELVTTKLTNIKKV